MESFDRQGLMSHLGARIARIAPGRVHIVLPARPEVTQQHGYVHAGATSAIADSAGGYAAYTLSSWWQRPFPDDLTRFLRLPGRHRRSTTSAVSSVIPAGAMRSSRRASARASGVAARWRARETARRSRPVSMSSWRRSMSPSV